MGGMSEEIRVELGWRAGGMSCGGMDRSWRVATWKLEALGRQGYSVRLALAVRGKQCSRKWSPKFACATLE